MSGPTLSPARRRLVAVLAALALVPPLALATTTTAAAAPGPDLAATGVATASLYQDDVDGTFPPEAVNDGDPGTRWASGNGPDADVPYTAWVQVDLLTAASVTGVTLNWEAAYAAGYEVQVATAAPEDPASWTIAHTEAAGDGGVDDITFAAAADARYVRVEMLQRVAFTWDPAGPHWYGYSLFDFQVQGTPAESVTAFATPGVAVGAGAPATVPVVLNGPATTERTVRVTSGGGTAVPGTDYTALDQVLTFPAGTTSVDVSLTTIANGPLAPVSTVDLTLSEPSAGLILGGRTTARITLTPTGDLPDVNTVSVIADFEAGLPAGYFPWGVNDTVRPVLSTVAAERDGAPAGNDVLQAAVGGPPAAGDWFGFANDFATPADWSDSDGFAFWFLGTGQGGSLRYEVKNSGRLFERTVVDDKAGWRLVNVAFAQLRLKGDPASDVRFDPSAATGYAVTLTDLGGGDWQFDDIALYQRAATLLDFEGDVDIAEPGETVGHFTYGSAGAVVSLAVTERERDGAPAGNHVLSGDYLIPAGGYGGFSNNRAAPADWSSFQGIRFLWYASQDNRPASPTAGADIRFEIKDGGPDGEHSELWFATFKDNWDPAGSRWKLVEIPFADMQIGAYQPGDAATQNGTLDLTSAWGYAFGFPAGTASTVGWAIDDVALYGSAVPAPTATVAADPAVTLVDPGQSAEVGVRLTTTDGEPLAAPVTVGYTDAPGTAQPGVHYTPVSGTLTFDAGTPSGTVQTVTVQTLATAAVDDSRSLQLTLTATGASVATSATIVLNAVGAPYLDETLPTEQRVADLLARMTLSEKIGQMAQAERLGLASAQQIAALGLGSLLSGGGSVPQDNTPRGWADMVDGYQRQALSTRLQIPLVYGVDAVHGHSNLVGATIFPHNSGLGAARDPDLVREVGEVTAVEVRGTGIPWTFAPCLCVTTDERWGRSYESFGEDPALVTAMAAPAVIGLQGEDPSDMSGTDSVLATAKHWVGDGGTRYEPSLAGSGYPIDQGVTYASSLEELRRLHVAPYLPAIEAGVGSMMPSYSAVDLGAGPVRMHENAALNNDLLKGELGFDGFLISDWEGIDKLPGGSYTEKVARAVNAGVDMTMAPFNFTAFIDAVTANVASGAITTERVDDAVGRILTQKFALGLFEQPLADRSQADLIGSAGHRELAREAAAASQVLLKNDGVLPLEADADIYVAGSNADNLGHQMGGWTIAWQGGSGDTTTGTSILEGIGQVAPAATVTYSQDASAPTTGSEVGVVVVGEPPYAEGIGDVGNNGRSLELPAADRAAIDTVCGALPCVVLVVAGRTQLVTDRLGAIDGLIASWLPGSEGAGVADTLFGAVPFTGRLPVSWPAAPDAVPVNVGDADYDPLFAYGWGLRTDDHRTRLEQARDVLAAGPSRDAIEAVLAADVWDGTAIGADPARVSEAVRLLATAATTLDGSAVGIAGAADLVVSVVRDLAQAAVTAGGPAVPDEHSSLTANAEQELMSGRAGASVALLAQVIGVDLTPPSRLLVSASADRSTPAPLDGSNQTRRLMHVFVEGEDITRVDFRLDGWLRHSERTAPWDLLGTRRNGTAVGFPTWLLGPGEHQVRAVVSLADGTTETLTATFVIDPRQRWDRP